MHNLRRFLDELFAHTPVDHYIELRWIPQNAKTKDATQVFFLNGKREDVLLAVEQAPSDVYVGVLPREKRNGTKGSVTYGSVLWADIDFKHSHYNSYAAIIRDLNESENVKPPSMVVTTGNGVHAYWLLSDTLLAWEIEQLNYGIRLAVGGDAVHDCTRIMRLPGTYNCKTTPPKAVTLHSSSTFKRYDSGEFSHIRVKPDTRIPSNARSLPLKDLKRLHVPKYKLATLPRKYKEILDHGYDESCMLVRDAVAMHGYVDRSSIDYRLARGLLQHGFTVQQTQAIFHSEQHAIHDRIAEMPVSRQRSYVERTVSRAFERLTQEGR